jgi:hypothetical protein
MNNQQSKKWYDNTSTVILLCLFIFPIGLYGLWKNQSIAKGWKIGVTALFVLMILSVFSGKNKTTNSTASKTTNNSTPQTETTTESTKNEIGLGDVLHTKYFDITANKASVKDRVKTGNEFADLKAEQGNVYLIINASFKNTDNESRMLTEGSVWINYNGKDYEFDKSETVMIEGWGLLLDQINPMITKTTNIVYKIPAEIKGNIYWQPGRADNDQRILLGSM